MQHDVAKKIINLASRSDLLSESEVSHLMTLCRKFLEHMPRKERDQYPILKFFCDWSLHIALERSPAALNILKRLNDALVELGSVPDTDLLLNRITAIVSLRELRQEMGMLLDRVEARDPIDRDQERWTNFVKHLIEIVRDCSLAFGDDVRGAARALYEEMMQSPNRHGTWVVGVSVVAADYGPLTGATTNPIFCLCITLSDTTRIVVPMAPKEVFSRPA